ncbi:hypothetical protein OHA57_00035 [Streptomyces anulatus]|uniref:hypothetical protein n=1 Tax=Streptomyces anulatus TaxID=1892 RepID=UPI002DDC777E|nr:hypothetical protein [Streptomyces anulatus]WSC59218.1 hypothetical protein OHA57_00035 [Streptomyces anulatus]
MDRFSFPDDLIRAQKEWHDTYRALAVPCPRRTLLRRRLLRLSVRIEGHPFWSTPAGRTPAARVELRLRAGASRRAEGAA